VILSGEGPDRGLVALIAGKSAQDRLAQPVLPIIAA
jgi:hypothetical protein